MLKFNILLWGFFSVFFFFAACVFFPDLPIVADPIAAAVLVWGWDTMKRADTERSLTWEMEENFRNLERTIDERIFALEGMGFSRREAERIVYLEHNEFCHGGLTSEEKRDNRRRFNSIRRAAE